MLAVERLREETEPLAVASPEHFGALALGDRSPSFGEVDPPHAPREDGAAMDGHPAHGPRERVQLRHASKLPDARILGRRRLDGLLDETLQERRKPSPI